MLQTQTVLFLLLNKEALVLFWLVYILSVTLLSSLLSSLNHLEIVLAKNSSSSNLTGDWGNEACWL